MGRARLTWVVVCLLLSASGATPAFAQIYETVGTRAQGMAGAFTAVSDDATATWWNPAGIALSYFSVVAELGKTEAPADPAPGAAAWWGQTGTFAAAFPALGLSYYKVRISEIAPALTVAPADPGRQDLGVASRALRTLSTHQLGATFGQSLGAHLVLATTLRLIRAGQTVSIGNSIDDADDLDVEFENSGDLDVGVMAILGAARIGATVKHLREPEFGDGTLRFRLKRQARAGAAWVVGQPGAPARLTFAGDVDLTSVNTAIGDARHLAGGAEFFMPGAHLAIRGGISANTVADFARSASVGGSIGVTKSLFVDGAATFGSDRTRKGWSFGVRLTI